MRLVRQIERPRPFRHTVPKDLFLLALIGDEEMREALLRVIEPVAGEISIDRYEAVRDNKHNVVAYKVWGHR